MKFLTKLGAVLLNIGGQISGVSPILKAFLPPQGDALVDQVQSELAQVTSVVTLVESMGQTLALTGQQKLAAAAPLVAQIFLNSSALARHPVHDPVLFKAGSEKFTSGLVDMLNALKADSIKA